MSKDVPQPRCHSPAMLRSRELFPTPLGPQSIKASPGDTANPALTWHILALSHTGRVAELLHVKFPPTCAQSNTTSYYIYIWSTYQYIVNLTLCVQVLYKPSNWRWWSGSAKQRGNNFCNWVCFARNISDVKMSMHSYIYLHTHMYIYIYTYQYIHISTQTIHVYI